jgi:hypothetical protein
MTLEVWLGWDDREPEVCRVAAKSLRDVSGMDPHWLRYERLRDAGLLWRMFDRRGGLHDFVSNAPCSTDFAISRFLVPILAQEGWALFCDGDVVFKRDPKQLMAYADPRFAVMVVKHRHLPTEHTKMDGREQVSYYRKNWSSVILWNCAHPANRRLTVRDVNDRTGLYLHQFSWLHDAEIGSLPAEWNVLINQMPIPEDPAILHFTLGCPGLPGWKGAPNDELWLEAARA